MIEAQVNDIITINNKRYKLIEKDGDCLGCAGVYKTGLCHDFHNYGMCSSHNRMDGKNIIYVEVK